MGKERSLLIFLRNSICNKLLVWFIGVLAGNFLFACDNSCTLLLCDYKEVGTIFSFVPRDLLSLVIHVGIYICLTLPEQYSAFFDFKDVEVLLLQFSFASLSWNHLSFWVHIDNVCTSHFQEICTAA